MDIVNNLNLVNYVNYVKSLPIDQKLIVLTSHPDWITNLILLDYYQDKDVILEDGDLLKLIESHRIGNIPRSGIPDNLDVNEVHYLMKAWKSAQYHRFMIHILDRYIKNKPYLSIENVPYENKIECGICWRSLHGINDNSVKDESFMKDVAFTSSNTRTHLCSSCLYQLFMFSQLMSLLDDKEFKYIMSK